MSVNSKENENWRLLLIPGLDQGQATTIKSFTLLDSRTGRPQGFLLYNGLLLEVNRFKQAHSSWLVGDHLLADGGIFLATASDPLFVLLPILDRARDKDESCPSGKFKQLEELLYDGSSPAMGELLAYTRGDAGNDGAEGRDMGTTGRTHKNVSAAASCYEVLDSPAVKQTEKIVAADKDGDAQVATVLETGAGQRLQPALLPMLSCLDQQLACICDVRRVDDTPFYRLNEDRVLSWLCCKFRRMQAALAPQLVGMDAPHAAAYVLGFLAEYVSDSWLHRVAARLGINEKQVADNNNNNNNTVLRPADGNTLSSARSRPPLAGPPEKKQKTDPRVAAKQDALAKQAVGTKKLTSFFMKK